MSKPNAALSDSDRTLTLPTLSRESGFGIRFLRAEANAGRLPTILVSPRGWRRVRVADWREYLERHRARLPSEDTAREHVRRVVGHRLEREAKA